MSDVVEIAGGVFVSVDKSVDFDTYVEFEINKCGIITIIDTYQNTR